MTKLEAIYDFASQKGYDISEFPLKSLKSMATLLQDGSCSIAVNHSKFDDYKEELWGTTHEVGHCDTGSFYNADSPADDRGRHEERSDRWAYRKRVPPGELGRLLRENRNIDELSDYFEVPPKVIYDAYNYYQIAGIPLTDEGNIAADKLARRESVEEQTTAATSPSTPAQPQQEAPPPQDKPKPVSPPKTHPTPLWGYVRRGYLIVFDQIQPGDIVMPPPKNQPRNDPWCPRIIQPVPNKPPRIRRGFDIDIMK